MILDYLPARLLSLVQWKRLSPQRKVRNYWVFREFEIDKPLG